MNKQATTKFIKEIVHKLLPSGHIQMTSNGDKSSKKGTNLTVWMLRMCGINLLLYSSDHLLKKTRRRSSKFMLDSEFMMKKVTKLMKMMAENSLVGLQDMMNGEAYHVLLFKNI